MNLFKVAISTVGCRANQADSGYLASHLDPERVEVVDRFDAADLVVINTCCVTAEAERDCRKRARRALKASPRARVVLAGCAVTAIDGFGKEISPRIEMRSGTAATPEALAGWINSLAGGAPDAVPDGDLSAALLGRTRGLLKIQTGCSHFCAYCIVPKARGKERSMPREAVLREVARFADAGVREVVLTGVQIGAWGKDLGGASLATLLLDAADRMGPGRIRLSSIEPWSVDEALIDAMASHPRICAHLHLPMQSGDDRILAAMRRGYDAASYLKVVERVRRRMPDAAIGTDVILGFPGEDDAAFRNTLQTLSVLEPAYLHAFTYSPRPGTRAALAENRPEKQTAQERTRIVRAQGEGFAEAARNTHLGGIREVIVEEALPEGFSGLTDTFVRVRFRAGDAAPGTLIDMRFDTNAEGVLWGTIVE